MTTPSELPVRAALHPSGLYLELREIGPEQLHDAFLVDTVERVPARQSVIQIFKEDLGKVSPASAPAGLIFHVGRCGSTLASQLLKQHQQVVVYSESIAINEILVPPHKWTRGELIGALRSLGDVFAEHASKPYILKLSSWNTLNCDIITDAFPSTPWAICIRDPLEVCVSLMQQRPAWLRDAGSRSNLFVSIVDPENTCHTPEEYLARLYAAYCRAACRLDTKRGKLIPYDTLPDAVWITLAPHFGLTMDEQINSRMSTASQIHSKGRVGSEVAFVPDSTTKRAAASTELRRAVDRYARPELERLKGRFA
ncbi:MAG: hypothetical protein ABI583_13515 [Betaproteobacteria bacterium]